MKPLAGIVAAGAALLVAAELALRVALGPPALTVLHPSIEYLFAPDQDVVRLGNRFRTNAHGMRSGPLPPAEEDHSYRLAVLGDSVINGGNPTDQDELATAILDGERIADGRTVRAMNISAGSWGPGNLLAYVDAFGLFDADYAVFVFSEHDLEDDRTFAPPSATTMPRERPVLALAEFVTRYLPRYVALPWGEARAKAEPSPLPGDARDSLEALARRVAGAGIPACVVLHPERGAPRAGPLPENLATIAGIFRRQGAVAVDGRAFLVGPEVYRDHIHPNARGQAALARAIASCDGLPLHPTG